MKINWFGHAAFRPLPAARPCVIAGPYTPAGVGYARFRAAADLVIVWMSRSPFERVKFGHKGEVGNPLTDAQQALIENTGTLFASSRTTEADHSPAFHDGDLPAKEYSVH